MELWMKSLHIIAMTAWMAGIFYLPRLFVYHATEPAGSATSETFKIMERRLLKAIMNPAMLVTWVAGIYLMAVYGYASEIWMWLKLVLVVAMTVFHMALGKWRKEFEADNNQRDQKFYRIVNEIPTVLLILIVVLVVVKPF